MEAQWEEMTAEESTAVVTSDLRATKGVQPHEEWKKKRKSNMKMNKEEEEEEEEIVGTDEEEREWGKGKERKGKERKGKKEDDGEE